ncbi:hypothetical protein T01_15052, partial [Trichinella spiralis]
LHAVLFIKLFFISQFCWCCSWNDSWISKRCFTQRSYDQQTKGSITKWKGDTHLFVNERNVIYEGSNNCSTCKKKSEQKWYDIPRNRALPIEKKS